MRMHAVVSTSSGSSPMIDRERERYQRTAGLVTALWSAQVSVVALGLLSAFFGKRADNKPTFFAGPKQAVLF